MPPKSSGLISIHFSRAVQLGGRCIAAPVSLAKRDFSRIWNLHAINSGYRKLWAWFRTTTSWPCFPNAMAAERPAMPAPTMITFNGDDRLPEAIVFECSFLLYFLHMVLYDNILLLGASTLDFSSKIVYSVHPCLSVECRVYQPLEKVKTAWADEQKYLPV